VRALNQALYVLADARPIVVTQERRNGHSAHRLRIMDPRYMAHGIGYITPTYFGFTRGSDREALSGLPGA